MSRLVPPQPSQIKATARRALRLARGLLGLVRLPVDWRPVLEADRRDWNRARTSANGGPRVLIATGSGGNAAITPVESMLAVALTLRGAQVHFLLCDRALPACLEALTTGPTGDASFARRGPSREACNACFKPAQAAYAQLGLPIWHHSQLTTAEESRRATALSASVPADAIPSFVYEGARVGEHAVAGALRFFARGDIQGEPHGEAVLRRYLAAGISTYYSVNRLLETVRPHVACFHHGLYVPQGVTGEVCRQKSVRVVNWAPAYRAGRFIFSHHETYHHTNISEPTAAWEHIPWNPDLDRQTMDYLDSRWEGRQDWFGFHDRPRRDADAILRELQVDPTRPCIGLLTNVLWDAQVHYPARAFDSTLSWLYETIRYFASRPDLQLVIRIHPAEIRGTVPSRQPVEEQLRQTFPSLPANVRVIPAESPVSTYAVMLRCDAVLIYGTKTGVELCSYGVPVIVAGEAWIRNKGLTMDATTAAEYFAFLDRLPLGGRLDEATIRRARMYAYHFFFRRAIPVPAIERCAGWPPYRLGVRRLNDLQPGRSPGLDVICDGILNGTPFIYQAERIDAAVEALST